MNIYVDARWVRTDFHDGISRYTSGIVQGFKDNKIPITLLIKDEKQLKMLPSDIPHLLINEPLSISELLLPFKLNKLGADAVFSPFQIIGSWGRKYKLIVTLHDTIYYLHPTAPTNLSLPEKIIWRLFHMARWPQRVLLNNGDMVATVSEYSKRNIKELGLTDRKICVIYNAPSTYKPNRQVKRTHNIIYMGSFMPYKNVEVLIKGMSHLPKEFSLHLLSKISDERKWELEKLIEPGVNVVFHNGVSDEQYVKMLEKAYCLASGSKEEGFGLPIIEAQMVETPVVCSDMAIFHEVAGKDALFFNYNKPEDFANKVLKLENEKVRKNVIEMGKKHSEKFTWQQSVKKLHEILQDLVSQKK